MDIKKSEVSKITVSDLDSLDPVTILLDESSSKSGSITIEWYGHTWSSYWDSINTPSLMDFILTCDNEYLANCLWDESKDQMEFDVVKFERQVKSMILDSRREQMLDKDFARELFDIENWSTYSPKHVYDKWRTPLFVDEGKFNEFVENFLNFIDYPEKQTSLYRTLLDIVNVVKKAFSELQTSKAA